MLIALLIVVLFVVLWWFVVSALGGVDTAVAFAATTRFCLRSIKIPAFLQNHLHDLP